MTEAPGARARRLSDRQRVSWVRLIRTENVGPATFRDLVNRFGSADAALEALPRMARSGGLRLLPKIPSPAEAEDEIAATLRLGGRLVAMGEDDYPPLMRRMEHPPPILAVRGEAAVFRLPPIAIVGARNASLAGIKIARMIASELGRNGYGIVSGLARGIDAAAHEASLGTGTVAVLAGGIDRPYPPENRALFETIVGASSAAISEMPLGLDPRARDFPRRNRLIAGMSHGLVVVEAALRSGSLISARLAGEMGRLVFAVPGSPLDPRCAGTNGLLKDGAILATGARDVMGQVAPMIGATLPDRSFEEPPDLSGAPEPAQSARERVVEALGPTPVAIDEIVAHTALAPAEIYLVLLELDLAGRLERHSGGMVSMIDAA